jgi:signal transduction histidine kinase
MDFPSLPKLEVPRLGLASFRGRLIFRGAFLLLALATLALAVALLREERERSYQNYQQNFRKTQAEIMARLRHPAGQLALLNPTMRSNAGGPLHPLVLPFAALDFDDQNKAQQAVEMAGCQVQYPDGGSLCVAVGNNPYAGGFLYLVGSFLSGPLQTRERGVLDLSEVHRAVVRVRMRGADNHWVAPFEQLGEPGSTPARGRLTGFVDNGETLEARAVPVRDFRGWLWQSGQCEDAAKRATPEPTVVRADPVEGQPATSSTPSAADCPKRAYFSIRLPVDLFREALFAKPRPIWPPADLDQVQVSVQMLAPGQAAPLLDSDAAGAAPPASLDDLRSALLPGETLTLRKLASKAGEPLAVLKGRESQDERLSPWISRLIRQLPIEGDQTPLATREILSTATGRYEVVLTGDLRGVDRALAIVATRVSWFVGAMLAAIALAWLVIEVGLIRRIGLLTKRAAAVSYQVQDARGEQRLGDLDVADLRGKDEVGILAAGLSDLLARVRDHVRREHIRAQQERDMWQAVGHEIMSPLQSLMVLHGDAADASHRYVQRMQQAVRVLYGSASPSEALANATLELAPLDLNEFLQKIAANAHFAGIEQVQFEPLAAPVPVRADEFSLEDVVTHILRNADRYRPTGTPITLRLSLTDSTATVSIHNQGPAIDPAMLDTIFEYGVSDADRAVPGEQRGQGLFVAKTYTAKMGGTISAENAEGGVCLRLGLPRVV